MTGIAPTGPHPHAAPADANDLLPALRAGDAAAFDRLVLLTQDRLFAVALRMLTRPEDALDAVQDAYLSAFKNLPRFEGGSSITTWLHRITVNACLMKMRSRRRRPEASIDDLLPRFLDDGHQATPSAPWNPHALSGIETREMAELVRAKIDLLPDPLRETLLLRDVEGLDTQAAADLLGVTVSVVKTRLHRARMALRALLEPSFSQEHS